MKEKWKPIKGYKKLYFISNFGNVKSISRKVICKSNSFRILKERILKPLSNKYGYCSVNLYKKGKMRSFTIHRLVGAAFISNPKRKKEINHKDGNKANNLFKNLEWVTSSENQKHAYKTGLQKRGKPMLGKFGINGKAISQFTREGNFINKFITITEASKKTKINAANIATVARGKLKTAGGFKWEFIN